MRRLGGEALGRRVADGERTRQTGVRAGDGQAVDGVATKSVSARVSSQASRSDRPSLSAAWPGAVTPARSKPEFAAPAGVATVVSS